ncbi:MAG: transposase [Nitrococcus mobilis]|nr:transposase [Nitrococcus mobilis]
MPRASGWAAPAKCWRVDGGKKIKGRKRPIAVDPLGRLIQMVSHAANGHDTIGGCEVLRTAPDKCLNLKGVAGDAGYRGTAPLILSRRGWN